MSADDIHAGRQLAPGEAIVWRGAPSWRRMLLDVGHLRGIAAYLAFLIGLDAYQAWAKAIPLTTALHNSVPLLVIIAIVLGNVVGFGVLLGRTTRYTITDRRVILDYGIAIPATLSLPFARIKRVSLACHADQTGDVLLALDRADHMPFLKLWPHARPWHLTHPQPMLRGVPQAAVVASLLAKAVAVREIESVRAASPAAVTPTTNELAA